MPTPEPESGETDEFTRTDLRTGQPALERSRRASDRNLLGRLATQITGARAVVAAAATLILAALVATPLGYTQRLLDEARSRVQLFGVPALTETTLAPQPTRRLATADWEKIPLPVPASHLNDFSADPTDPESVLVCGHSTLETPTIQGEITPRGPIAIWRSRDAGKTWTQSQSPAISGTYCWISRASDAPQRLTLTIEHPSPIKPRCAEYDVLLSDDDGASWRPTPMTVSATEDAVQYCSHGALIVRGRLFLYTNWSTGQAESDLHASVARSDDGGRHWSEVSGDSAQFLHSRLTSLVDGTLLTARWPPPHENPQNTSTLWTSQDRGDSWRPLSTLQGIVPNEALTPFGATSAHATSARPLYLSAASHLPSRLLVLKAAQIVDDRHWAYLPPLPVNGASADHVGITSMLGVTASGTLLAFGVSPTADIAALRFPDEDFQQQWLWSWDPHAQRWTSLTPPLPLAWTACSDGCWQASFARTATSQPTVLWVRGYVSEDHAFNLSRLRLPAETA